VNYYKRHIGDYAKKAGHLSVLEHGVYTLLLDAYYDREQAPTRAEALRQARARTPEEVAAVDAVLADFFTLDGDRYTQRRVEEEFVKAEQVAKANAAKGKLGGRPRKPKGKPEESRQLSEVKPDESPEKPNPLIHQSTTKQEPKQERSPTGSRLPPDWTPSDADASFAANERPDVDWRNEADKFRDYWHGVAGAKGRKADWPSTWRNWIRRADGNARAGPAAAPSKHLTGLANILGVSPHDLTDQQHPRAVVRHADRELLGDDLRSEPRRLPGR
jgi:uncharacterized protein YdaU (DUF1376 family)